MAFSRTMLTVASGIALISGLSDASLAQADHEAAAKAIIAHQTDWNADGVIDEAELAHHMAAVFVALDINADDKIEPNELADHDAASFTRIDGDGDGSLSFIEVMTAKIDDLRSVDEDDDGALSPDELQAMDDLR